MGGKPEAKEAKVDNLRVILWCFEYLQISALKVKRQTHCSKRLTFFPSNMEYFLEQDKELCIWNKSQENQRWSDSKEKPFKMTLEIPILTELCF